MTALPETATRTEFARIIGVRPGYVTQLGKEGRLVLTENGRQVRVAESIQRIEETRDPSKAGVRARHAKARAAASDAAAVPETPLPPPVADPVAADHGGDTSKYQRARAARESYLAMQAKLDLEERLGKLVPADEVRDVAASMGVVVRRKLETLPHILSAQLPEADRDRVYAIATDVVEQALSDLSHTYASGIKETRA